MCVCLLLIKIKNKNKTRCSIVLAIVYLFLPILPFLSVQMYFIEISGKTKMRISNNSRIKTITIINYETFIQNTICLSVIFFLLECMENMIEYIHIKGQSATRCEIYGPHNQVMGRHIEADVLWLSDVFPHPSGVNSHLTP